jgi:YegS/Rv2252/BmrU family lipid kinase
MHRFKLIANPVSGGGRTLKVVSRAVDQLMRRGIDFDVELTNAPRHATEIALRSCDGFDAVVAVGGDGTIHEVAAGLLRCGKPLGIIPAGSGNDLVKSLGVPVPTEQAVDTLLAGRTRVIDTGMVNGLCFVNVVGIGFDAAVNHNSHGLRRPASGLMRYVVALVRTLGTYDPVRLGVTMNGSRSEERDLFLLTIGNGTTCGGGFRLTPHAKLDDGLLDVTMVRPIGVLPLLWHLPKVFGGTLDRAARYASMTTARTIRVESEAPVPVHVDGEIYRGDTTRLQIEVLPQALTVIVKT